MDEEIILPFTVSVRNAIEYFRDIIPEDLSPDDVIRTPKIKTNSRIAFHIMEKCKLNYIDYQVSIQTSNEGSNKFRIPRIGDIVLNINLPEENYTLSIRGKEFRKTPAKHLFLFLCPLDEFVITTKTPHPTGVQVTYRCIRDINTFLRHNRDICLYDEEGDTLLYYMGSVFTLSEKSTRDQVSKIVKIDIETGVPKAYTPPRRFVDLSSKTICI